MDAVNPAGLNLSQLAGLSTIAGVLLVGTSGSGAQYTDLQAALDAVPANSSLTNPHLIQVMSGVYTKCLTVEKAGITIQALGRVEIRPDSLNPCLTIQATVTTFPTSLTLLGLTVIQPGNGLACVKVNGGAGSTVGADGIVLAGCDLLPTGVGGYTVYADAVNKLVLRDCQTTGVPVSASLRVSQCASLVVVGGTLPAVQADYNSAGVIPSIIGSSYVLIGCQSVGNTLSTLTGGGSLAIQACPVVGTVTVNGNRTLSVQGSDVGALTLNGTTAATLKNSTRGVAAGAGTLLESQVSGVQAFAVSAVETVTFPVARPNANYTVALDTGVATTAYVTNKLAGSFDITFTAPVTTTVFWTVTS